MQYQFEIDIAAKYGVDEAIFIHNLYFWILKNQANKKHFYQEKTWTYNSIDALCKIFPFWTNRQIERIVKKCEEKGLIFIGNFNKKPMDRTRWFAVSEVVCAAYAPFHQTVECISPNSENHFTKRSNAFTQTVPAIPDSKPDSKPDKREARHPRSPNGWVKLTDEELDRLASEYGKALVAAAVVYVDESAQINQNKNKWRDWNLVVRKAIKNNWGGCCDKANGGKVRQAW